MSGWGAWGGGRGRGRSRLSIEQLILDFSSGHHLRIVRSSPMLGSTFSEESA